MSGAASKGCARIELATVGTKRVLNFLANSDFVGPVRIAVYANKQDRAKNVAVSAGQ